MPRNTSILFYYSCHKWDDNLSKTSHIKKTSCITTSETKVETSRKGAEESTYAESIYGNFLFDKHLGQVKLIISL